MLSFYHRSGPEVNRHDARSVKQTGHLGNIYIYLVLVAVATTELGEWFSPLKAATTSQSDSTDDIRSARRRCICETFA